MLFLLLFILPLALGTSPYVPGTPGAPWTDYELLTGAYCLCHESIFHLCTVSTHGFDTKPIIKQQSMILIVILLNFYRVYFFLFPVKAKLFRLFRVGISAPAVLRLGFHDCLKYKDGAGGCDGCLNWHGMGVKSLFWIFLFYLNIQVVPI